MSVKENVFLIRMLAVWKDGGPSFPRNHCWRVCLVMRVLKGNREISHEQDNTSSKITRSQGDFKQWGILMSLTNNLSDKLRLLLCVLVTQSYPTLVHRVTERWTENERYPIVTSGKLLFSHMKEPRLTKEKIKTTSFSELSQLNMRTYWKPVSFYVHKRVLPERKDHTSCG